jgi:hypothetical protein
MLMRMWDCSCESTPDMAARAPTVANSLPVQVVAREDVSEQVRLQVFVDLRRELEQRPFDRSTRELGLIGGA